ncbi:MAG: hypothetical protein B7Z70_09220, partial [Acidithiobacillus ferrivorans]
YRLWRLRQRPRQLLAGQELRVLLQAPFTLHWGINGWQSVQDTDSEDWDLGHVVLLPVQKLSAGDSVQFAIRWRASGDWQGEDFHIDIIGGDA